MPRFAFDFTVRASLDAVRQFHHGPEVLVRLTPPPVIARLHRGGPMEEGMIAEFTLWLGPLPIRWRARHEQVGPTGFADVMDAGPLRRWRHEHRFVPLDESTTRIEERVEYEHPPGWRGLGTRLLFNALALRGLFWYRAWVTRRALSRVSPDNRG